MTINRKIRGIRDSIPPGYIIGRSSGGNGPPQLIKLSDLAQQLATQGGGQSALVSAANLSAAIDAMAGSTLNNVLTRTSSGWKAQAAGGGAVTRAMAAPGQGAANATAFATKGTYFTTTASITISELWAQINPTGTQQFIMTLATLSGNGASPTITSIDQQSAAQTPAASPTSNDQYPIYKFPLPGTKTYAAGVTFGVMLTWNNSTTTAACPIVGSNGIFMVAPACPIGFLREASINPQVSDSFAGNTGATPIMAVGFGWQ